MRLERVKLQKRSFTAAVTLPRAMVLALPDDTVYMEARQYSSGRITLRALDSEGVEK